jgi:hypothetical protein
MEIYLAGLAESASHTRVGKTWMLDREKVMHDLAITGMRFDRLQRDLEGKMLGAWDKASATDRNLYVYMRLA